MEISYWITFHFDGTTLTSVFDTKENRDDYFNYLSLWLTSDTDYCLTQDEAIINLKKVLYITKGEGIEWKSANKH